MAEDRAERDEDALAMERLEAVLAAVEAGDAGQLDVLLEPLHAADVALLNRWAGDRRLQPVAGRR
jgi:hypothetical protein